MANVRHFLLLLLISFCPGLALAQSGTVFYACAHPDDCVLFMNPNLYNDVTADDHKVVVIYVTSGDDGLPFDKAYNSYPYVREIASLDSTDWMVDKNKPEGPLEREVKEVSIADHAVTQVTYDNTVSYFLRLPDGAMLGSGFPLYNQQSMKKLKEKQINRVNPIDKTPEYHDWQEVVAVLSAIVDRESKGEQNITIHLQDPDITKNINDHSDHTAVGTAMMQIAESKAVDGRCYHLYKHLDYVIASMAENLFAEDLQNKAGSFAVLTATQQRHLGFHNWDADHLPYIPHNYFSQQYMPENCAGPKR